MNGDHVLDVVFVYSGSEPPGMVVNAVDGHGTPLPGWPVTIADAGAAEGCSVGDSDGDGDFEIFVSTSGTLMLYGFDHLGHLLPGWFQPLACSVLSAVSLGDVNGDGLLEIAFQDCCSRTFVCNSSNGSRIYPWPIKTGSVVVFGPPFHSTPVLADIDGDGVSEIISGSEGSSMVHAWNADGTLLPNFPKRVGDDGVPGFEASPEVTDLDGDGMADLVACARDGGVYVWKLGTPFNPCRNEWPRLGNQAVRQSHHDRYLDAISVLKTRLAGSEVYIRGAVVTASFPGYFYVESDTRESGIRVDKPGHAFSAGVRADVAGTMKTSADGERYVCASSALLHGTGSVEPFGLSGYQIGGAGWFYDALAQTGQQGIQGAYGLNNIGLLVTVWGKVTYVGTDHFYLDDGSRCKDGSGKTGIKVMGFVPVNPGEDPVGQNVEVTGISSCFKVAGNLQRLIRAREVTVLGPWCLRSKSLVTCGVSREQPASHLTAL